MNCWKVTSPWKVWPEALCARVTLTSVVKTILRSHVKHGGKVNHFVHGSLANYQDLLLQVKAGCLKQPKVQMLARKSKCVHFHWRSAKIRQRADLARWYQEQVQSEQSLQRNREQETVLSAISQGCTVHLQGTVVQRWTHSSSAEQKTEESLYLLLVASLTLLPSFLNLKDRSIGWYHFFFLSFAGPVEHRLGTSHGTELHMCFLTIIYFGTGLLNFFNLTLNWSWANKIACLCFSLRLILFINKLLSRMLGIPLTAFL